MQNFTVKPDVIAFGSGSKHTNNCFFSNLCD